MELRIELDDQAAQFIEDRITTGRNTSAADVIREGLMRLAADDELAGLREALAIGVGQAERGETVPWRPGLLGQVLDAERDRATDATQATHRPVAE